MSKIFYRLIILGFIGLLFSPFILKDSEGRALMTIDEFLSFDTDFIKKSYRTAVNMLRGVSEAISEGDSNSSNGVTKLYKWKDENGEWHFGDKKPEQYEGEEVSISHSRNVLSFDDVKNSLASEAEALLEKKSGGKAASIEKGEKEKSPLEGGPAGYIKKMTNTLDDAQSVQDKINENYQKKVEAMDGL